MSKKRNAAGARPPAAPSSGKKAFTPALAGVAFGLFVVIVIVWFWKGSQDRAAGNAAAAASPPATAAATVQPSAAFAGRAYPSQGHAHLNPTEPDDFSYNSTPPTSGPHKEIFSDQFVNPSPLPAYVQVHLLEHGNILLQYDCTCPDIAASLSTIAYVYDSKLTAPNELQPTSAEVQAGEEQGKAVIVAPYPHMKSKIALTAWTRVGELGSVDKTKIESFIAQYLGNVANASQ